MTLRFALLFALLVLATGAGCDGPKPTPAPAAAPAASSPTAAHPAAPDSGTPQFHLDHAQPKLATVKLWVGSRELEAEVCRTLQQLSTGLMFRPGIGEQDGMLFVFPVPQRTAFYMKNVSFDIDAAYLDPEGVITEIVRLKKMDPTPVPAASDNIQFVLETAPGWFERNGIGVGALIRTSKRSLREEFGVR